VFCVSPGCTFITLLRIWRIEDAFAVKPPRFPINQFCIEEGLLFDVSTVYYNETLRRVTWPITVKNISTFDVTIRSENFKFLFLREGGSKEPFETESLIYRTVQGEVLDTDFVEPSSDSILLKPGEEARLGFGSFLKNRKMPRPVCVQLLVSGIIVGDKEVSFSIYAKEE
jgi:hypothetical protein